MTQVSKARSVANKPQEIVSVLDFGAVGDGVTDDTAAIQAAIDYCLGGVGSNNGKGVSRTLYLPTGRYRITGELNTDSAAPNNVFSILGDGPKASTICDDYAGGVGLRSTGISFLTYMWEGFGFEVWNNKPTSYCVEIESATINSQFSNIEWSGKKISMLGRNQVRALLYMHDNWQMTFTACEWRDVDGIGFISDCPTLNGGNVSLIEPTFQYCRCGMWIKGGSTNNSFHFSAPKFVQGLSERDHETVSDTTTFTTGSTSVNLGAGWTTIAADLPLPAFIGNDVNTEVHMVTAYDSGTGLATLSTALLSDYSTESSVEVILGSMGLVTSPNVPSIVIDAPHFERNALVLSGCQGFVANGFFASHSPLGTYFGGTNSFIAYITARAANIIFNGPVYSTVRADRAWLSIINAAGVGGYPGPVRIEGATRVSGGSSSFIEPGYVKFGSSVGNIRVFERAGYKFERDTQETYAGRVLAAGTGNGLPDGWTSTKISTGRYQVTHNFGSSSYVVVPVSEGNFYARVNSISTNTFEYYTLNPTTNIVTDSNSSFILATINDFIPG